MSSPVTDKGGRLEELLRNYFRRNGYFVVRGVPVSFGGSDVTDIDLWLYQRTSTLTRVRINVDAKSRVTPKALERIVWAKGLQTVLGFDQCIVATPDKRESVKQFGILNGVLVLDGWFLNRLEKASLSSDRMAEEELLDVIVAGKLDKLAGNWKGRFLNSKARLADQLGFDGCNGWLEDIRVFVEQTMISDRRESACRLLYLSIAFLLIGLDYASRILVLEDADSRRKALLDGFRYGTRGKKRTEELLRIASDLIASYSPGLRSKSDHAVKMALAELGGLPAEILTDYFSRKEIEADLFVMGCALEEFAYARLFHAPTQIPVALQGAIGMLLDYLKVDRKSFFERFPIIPSTAPAAGSAAP